MGSVGNQNPWTPYDNYKDCSLGICSIYCPQFCYFIFPPPPPSDNDSGTPFSPLIIAIIGVLASAFLLVSYYTIVTRYCRRGSQNAAAEAEEDRPDQAVHDQWQVASTGLDEALIKTITVCRYQKGDGLIEGTECAVCLSEFQENESLRLLPKCSHAFHLPCIDTWLKSHSNCPLCRANVTVLAQPSPPPVPSSQPSSAANVDSHEIQQPDYLVLVVDDQERNCGEQVAVSLFGDHDDGGDDDATPKSPIQDNESAEDAERRNENLGSDQEIVKQSRRSVSLGTFPFQRHLLISDILNIEEIDENIGGERDHSWRDVGSSKGSAVEESKSSADRLVRNLAVRRSNSTGRFMFIDHDKGKNSILPN